MMSELDELYEMQLNIQKRIDSHMLESKKTEKNISYSRLIKRKQKIDNKIKELKEKNT